MNLYIYGKYDFNTPKDTSVLSKLELVKSTFNISGYSLIK